MFSRFMRALDNHDTLDARGWPTDVLKKNPQIVEYLQSQGLTNNEIDGILVSVITGHWDLTSAYICCTGSAPSADERPHFLADFLTEHHRQVLDSKSFLQFGKLLLQANLI